MQIESHKNVSATCWNKDSYKHHLLQRVEFGMRKMFDSTQHVAFVCNGLHAMLESVGWADMFVMQATAAFLEHLPGCRGIGS